MNHIYISPEFPENFKHFAVQMAGQGINVLGIGSQTYDFLDPDLRAHLTEYYYVKDMDNYQDMLKACGYFTFKYGKIDRIESHNEHWLGLDAQLREDFNVYGLRPRDMERIKYKSAMKKVFIKAGIPVARGLVIKSLKEARTFAKKVGFPIIAKPDMGVGAAKTYKLENDKDLVDFFLYKDEANYIFEEFIQGQIVTFDGLTDAQGKIVFTNSFAYYTGVMDTVNQDLDMYLYSLREIPDDLKKMGTRALKFFDIRERFFHLEFFRLEDGGLVALEANFRPPGGYCLDIINYGQDGDVYLEYAKLLTNQESSLKSPAPYYSIYVGVKDRPHINHIHSREQILEKHAAIMRHHSPVNIILSAAMGDYAFFLRSEDLQVLLNAADYIMEGNRPQDYKGENQ